MCVAHGAALRDFKPARSPVNLVYYKAAERDEFTPSNSDRFWRRLASGDVKVHQAEGNHISMLSPGHVKGLAQSISSYLG
jgi:thioesterase domain-containing protein